MNANTNVSAAVVLMVFILRLVQLASDQLGCCVMLKRKALASW